MSEEQKVYTREQIKAAFQFWFEYERDHPDEIESWDGVEIDEAVKKCTDYIVDVMDGNRA